MVNGLQDNLDVVRGIIITVISRCATNSHQCRCLCLHILWKCLICELLHSHEDHSENVQAAF